MWDAETEKTSGSMPSATANQLLKSTIIAATTALAVVVCVFLPAEHAIDPTGIGRLLGLTQMGEIKHQLATYAAQDASRALRDVTHGGALTAIEKRLQRIEERLESHDRSGTTATP
jgi:hypothetical protein